MPKLEAFFHYRNLDVSTLKELCKRWKPEIVLQPYLSEVTVSGDLEIKSITIDPQAVDPEDVELLQDMVLAAVNEGMRSAQELASLRVAKRLSALRFPTRFLRSLSNSVSLG